MTDLTLGRLTDRSQGMLCAVIAVLLWATVGVVYKLTLSRLDSFTVTVNVGLIATFVLGINVLAKSKIDILVQEFRRQPWFFCIAGILGTGMQQVFYLKGFQLLATSQVTILFYLYPLLMIVLSAILFKERVSGRSILLILIGILGITLAIADQQSLQSSWTGGTIATLLAAVSWALFSLLIKHRTFDADCGMLLFNLFGILFLIGMIPALGWALSLKVTEWLGMIYLALFPTAIAFILWQQALHLASTTICSSIALLTPLISLFLAIVTLHESILLVQWIGLIILLGAVLLNINHLTRLASENKTASKESQ